MLFKDVNKHLEKNGLILWEGRIVDTFVISPPSSTKNESGKRNFNRTLAGWSEWLDQMP